MRHGHGRDGEAGPFHRHERLHRRRPDEGVVGAGKPEKIGPDATVEDVGAEEPQHLGRGEHLGSVGTGFVDVVEKQRQRRDVIDVLVGHEHVPHPPLPSEVGEQP